MPNNYFHSDETDRNGRALFLWFLGRFWMFIYYGGRWYILGMCLPHYLKIFASCIWSDLTQRRRITTIGKLTYLLLANTYILIRPSLFNCGRVSASKLRTVLTPAVPQRGFQALWHLSEGKENAGSVLSIPALWGASNVAPKHHPDRGICHCHCLLQQRVDLWLLKCVSRLKMWDCMFTWRTQRWEYRKQSWKAPFSMYSVCTWL